MEQQDYTSIPYPPAYYLNLKQGSEEWKKRRQDFAVTGSKIADVLNLGAYGGNAKKLFKHKKANTEEKFSTFQTEVIFAHGTKNEPVAAGHLETWLKEEYPDKDWTVAECGINVHKSKKNYYYGASPDRLIVNNDGTIAAIVEIKCPYKKVLHWNGFQGYLNFLKKTGCTPPLPLTDTRNIRIYTEYFLQMQMQMCTCKVEFGFFVGWTPKEMVIVRVDFNQEIWDLVEGKLDQFVDALNTNNDKNLIDKQTSAKIEQKINECQDKHNKLVYFKEF